MRVCLENGAQGGAEGACVVDGVYTIVRVRVPSGRARLPRWRCGVGMGRVGWRGVVAPAMARGALVCGCTATTATTTYSHTHTHAPTN